VCFSEVPGYATPACQTINVSTGATTTLTGLFAQDGYLQVVTSPAVSGTVYVDGIPRDDWGVWTEMPPATYDVCFGQVTGLANTPACQSVSVTPGQTATVTGTYS
jgi:hypothetical protein